MHQSSRTNKKCIYFNRLKKTLIFHKLYLIEFYCFYKLIIIRYCRYPPILKATNC
ncbi:MAG: hypothetical protein ACI88A_004021 [Paraglaciecola sp.]|jgi:hypothetical protein